MSRIRSRLFQLLCFPALIVGLLLIACPVQSEVIDTQRTELQDGIVHYTFDVDLGPAAFDMIRLHRIVKEKRAGKPVSTVDGIFMLPGAPNSFEMVFLPPMVSDVPSWDQSIAVFLAKNDIDVWGMDYAWAMVPPGTADFGFMEGWGLERDIDYAEQALDMVHLIRRDTGQGNRRLHVLGFSYGGPIAYVMAANETLLPPGMRRINGIIALDAELKVAEEERAASCIAADNGQTRIDGGDFANPNGMMLAAVGTLAEFWPDEPSPIIAGLNNWQVALLLGAMDNPTWHFVAGEFNPYGIPTGLTYTDSELWIDLLQYVPPYVPRQAFVDLNTTWCDEVDVSFDDHLADITVPIFAVGAAGGAAPVPFTPWLTASQDFGQLTIQFLPDELHWLDFGHGDLLMAGNADAEVWQPILDWLIEHRAESTYP